ncbi:hypothetical protein EFA46_000495 [Halarchaeum sp. CBA1220]|uniref:Uncharacterized protein n=1 Tax=Halarchaeum grantii TaxID=1193105 RepID=A0A830F6Q7_9EURY|nr:MULTISPECIES: hypothetical protein [Halarchaeum]QLC32748.1 hypothetical protein EFA46_000495 [Halarchaeum sp. CBA1220]GGL24606.1 hypothetical protein GCM10009037_05210 [Halarchaeum grantii]
MVPSNTPPVDEAREIFTDLGYEVTGDAGNSFRAAREWKEVDVLAVTDDVSTGDGDRMRCFVTWNDHVERLERALDADDHDYEWAVIGVAEDGEYQVARAPPTP